MSSIAKKIMMIDDDTINNIIMNGIVRTIPEIEDFHIYNSSYEALEVLSQADKSAFPDVILVDLKMPEMDGFEFIEQFEKKFGTTLQTKLYIATSSVSSRDKEKGTSIKFISGFIIKPLTKEKLMEIIKS